MEDVSSLFIGLALMILFAVTSMRFGAESRDGFRPQRADFVPRDGGRAIPSAAPRPQKAVRGEDSRPVATPSDCGLAPCAA
jgi:hypothetical protein